MHCGINGVVKPMGHEGTQWKIAHKSSAAVHSKIIDPGFQNVSQQMWKKRLAKKIANVHEN